MQAQQAHATDVLAYSSPEFDEAVLPLPMKVCHSAPEADCPDCVAVPQLQVSNGFARVRSVSLVGDACLEQRDGATS